MLRHVRTRIGRAVTARHVEVWPVMLWFGGAVMFGNGESGTGGVLLGNVSLGKAVMFGHV